MADSNRPPRPGSPPERSASPSSSSKRPVTSPEGAAPPRSPSRDLHGSRQGEHPPQGRSSRAPGHGHHSEADAPPAPPIERVVLYPCFRGQFRPLSLFGLLSLLAIYGSWAIPSLTFTIQLWGDAKGGGYLVIPTLVVLPLVPLLRALIAVYDATYVIDDDGIEARIGLLSLKLRLPKLRWEDIRGSALKQGLLERVLNVGTIEVDSAMTEDVEIMMAGVADARTVHQMIMKERERRWREAGHLWHVEKALTD